MGITGSLLLIALGAILDFAVKVNTSGFNLNTAGVILMIIGVIGFIASLAFWSSWGSGMPGSYRRSRSVTRDPVGGGTYIEESGTY